MNKTFLVLSLLCVANVASAQDSRSFLQNARPSMPYVGTATMYDDGTISLHLRLTSDGKSVDDTLICRVSDRPYDNILRHLGGLRPGETKQFTPWKD